jgi:hypothetical protein
MSEIGRDYRQHTALMDTLERIAAGIEKLAEEPVLEMEVAPPVCPHCGVFNPKISVADGMGGEGPLAEWFLEMTCQECGAQFYGAPVQWSMHRDTETLRHELHERAEYVRRSDRTNAAARAS